LAEAIRSRSRCFTRSTTRHCRLAVYPSIKSTFGLEDIWKPGQWRRNGNPSAERFEVIERIRTQMMRDPAVLGLRPGLLNEGGAATSPAVFVVRRPRLEVGMVPSEVDGFPLRVVDATRTYRESGRADQLSCGARLRMVDLAAIPRGDQEYPNSRDVRVLRRSCDRRGCRLGRKKCCIKHDPPSFEPR